ncbi:response regulator transcription factor [Polycladospora coralii]|uniref:response regulator transcription factor n=1 Tax=Polycladospora coralii TaxID=2771432 RepID=UPI003D2FC9D8
MLSRILLVDDEVGLLDMIYKLLKREGMRNVDTATTGKKTMEFIHRYDYDLIVLDVKLPDASGFDICQEIRQISEVPILFLTSYSTDTDKLIGFGYGADDYVAKPFHSLELIARIKALLRRQQLYRNQLETIKTKPLHFGHIQIVRLSAELYVNGNICPCSAHEFQLLLFFCDHPNIIFSIEQLYEKVWKQEAINVDKTVVMCISRLRKKIEPNPKKPSLIVNIYGLGYKFVPPQR